MGQIYRKWGQRKKGKFGSLGGYQPLPTEAGNTPFWDFKIPSFPFPFTPPPLEAYPPMEKIGGRA